MPAPCVTPTDRSTVRPPPDPTALAGLSRLVGTHAPPVGHAPAAPPACQSVPGRGNAELEGELTYQSQAAGPCRSGAAPGEIR